MTDFIVQGGGGSLLGSAFGYTTNDMAPPVVSCKCNPRGVNYCDMCGVKIERETRPLVSTLSYDTGKQYFEGQAVYVSQGDRVLFTPVADTNRPWGFVVRLPSASDARLVIALNVG